MKKDQILLAVKEVRGSSKVIQEDAELLWRSSRLQRKNKGELAGILADLFIGAHFKSEI